MKFFNKKEEETNAGSGQPQQDSAIVGRVDDCRNTQFEDEAAQADISHVDRQEGTMNNGVLGGSFDQQEDKK